MRIVFALLATTSLAAADGKPDTPKTTEPERDVGLAVNAPFGWHSKRAVASSGYIKLAEHHALRANVARYHYPGLAREVFGAVQHDEVDAGPRHVHIFDAGVAWMFFPRSFCDGLSFEVGALVRRRDTRIEDDTSMETTFLRVSSTTLAGRAMLGWSWTVGNTMFIAVSAGLSVGYERGTEAKVGELASLDRYSIARKATSGEGTVRFGFLFEAP